MGSIHVEFRELSPSEFFYRYREIAGYSNPTRAFYQTVKELIENALDACDSHGILPSVKVEIEEVDVKKLHYMITVEDNGIGVSPKHVPKAFGQVLYGSKYKQRQTRGIFGLGVKMAILYGQVTTGKPVIVITKPIRSKYRWLFKIRIDIKKNRPIILHKESWKDENGEHGTKVSIVIEGDWFKAKSRIHEYVKRTAIATPYAEIFFKDPQGRTFHYPRKTTNLPPIPKEIKPHPHGIDVEMLKALILTTKTTNLLDFLSKTFQNIGEKSAKEFLKYAHLDPSIRPSKLTIDDLSSLAKKLKEYPFKPPKGNALSPLGEEIIAIGLRSVLEPEFVATVSRKPSAYSGHPFIIEVGIAYGGKIPVKEYPQLYRFANKIPLLYDEKACVMWKMVSEINWKNYNIEFPAPLAILIHICSTKIPFKGVGKESIAEVPEIEKEIRKALREAGRRLRKHVERKRREREAMEKIIAIAKYIPEISKNLAELSKASKGKGVSSKELENILYSLLEMKAEKMGIGSINIKQLIKGKRRKALPQPQRKQSKKQLDLLQFI